MNALEQAEKLAEIASIKDRGVPAKAAVERLGELLSDESSDVRAEAADAVWGYPGETDLVQATLQLAKSDESPNVRGKALGALGAVIREADLLGGDSGVQGDVKAHLLSVLGGDPGAERRAGLESLAYLSSESLVTQAIDELAGSDDPAARAVAVRCMGRSGDPRWASAIREAVEANDAGLVTAGIVAAGLVEVVDLVPLLSRILRGSREPKARRLKAAAALSRLGGKNTAGVLLEVAGDAQDDDALREAASSALSALTLLSGEVTT